MRIKQLFLILYLTAGIEPALNANLHAADTIPANREIAVTLVGDIMLGTSFPSTRFLPPGDDPLRLLGDLADTLAASDITCGNLEGSFLDEGEPAKKCRDTTICYLFRMPERYAGALAVAGFDFLSLANNHFGDFGPPSRIRTMEILDSLGISYGGLLEYPLSFSLRDTLLYGFCAFAPNAGTVSINDIEGAEKIVKGLADTCDIVVVSFHGGAEGADYQHVKAGDEMFHTENRGDVIKFSHRMIDAGADIVYGHGPHVTRAVEVYKERFIAYSLGNFCTYGRFNLSGPNGIAPVIRISTDVNGKFLSGRIIPVFQSYGGGVRKDPAGRVIKTIRELTSSDFPDAVINIDDLGKITYK
ncbi:MAG TPA: CapA family protein [Bacteroidales bacterium]|nr:CapA family protein [Bacteroidales bacterium]HPJ59160.1 CapA family protein [Bacteroidales bacterium]HPR12772.1 CapA family protein [Bacteroidales bacterium]HRW84376.1 CapA family protein [Bacteroidales bacterium]